MAAKKQRGGDVQGASPPPVLTRYGSPIDPVVYRRIVTATLDVVASVGFAATKAEDIIATAGIGRRSFWKYFPDKAAALAAAYAEVTQDLRAAVQTAHDQEPDPVRRVTACLAAIADFLAAEPARAEVLLVQGPCAGRAVIEVRTETMRRLAKLLATTIAEVVPGSAGSPDRPPIVVESLAGGLYEVAYARTFTGHVRDLPALVPDLARLVLTPYIGREAARVRTDALLDALARVPAIDPDRLRADLDAHVDQDPTPRA